MMPFGQREALQADFQQWNIWASDAGHWYATRRQLLSVQAEREELALAMLGSLA